MPGGGQGGCSPCQGSFDCRWQLLKSVRGELGEPFRAALRRAQGERWKRLYQDNRQTLTGGGSTVPIQVVSFVRQGQTHRSAPTSTSPFVVSLENHSGQPFDGLRANGGRGSTKIIERPCSPCRVAWQGLRGLVEPAAGGLVGRKGMQVLSGLLASRPLRPSSVHG